MKVVLYYAEKLRSSSIVLKSEGSIMLKSWGQQKIRLHFTLQKLEVVFNFIENKWGWDDFLFIQDYSRQPVGPKIGGLDNKDNSGLALTGADLGN